MLKSSEAWMDSGECMYNVQGDYYSEPEINLLVISLDVNNLTKYYA